MKIAIDISPVSRHSTSAHKVRGVGIYINMLVTNLPRFDNKNEYVFVQDKHFPADADLIHYPYFDPFFITLPFRLPEKFVVTVHDLTPLVFPEHFPAGVRGKLRWMLQKSRLKKANMVMTDSDRSSGDVRNIAGVGENKVRTVYLAADERFMQVAGGAWQVEVSKKYNLPEKFLLYVGDATWNKNLPRLISAIEKTPYPLVLVGKIWSSSARDISNNSWNEDLKHVFSKIENNSKFIRLGFVEAKDLRNIYNMAGALLMPSIYEGFGLPILEAMNCGCPVITSNEGSLPEIGGDAVYYTNAYDTQSISDGIKKLMKNIRLREDLSRKGLARAKKFTTQAMMENIIKSYEAITYKNA